MSNPLADIAFASNDLVVVEHAIRVLQNELDEALELALEDESSSVRSAAANASVEHRSVISQLKAHRDKLME